MSEKSKQEKEGAEENEEETDKEKKETKSRIILSFTTDDVEGLEDYDKGEEIDLEMTLEVIGKEIIEKLPEETEEGEKITDVDSEPKYKLKLEFISANITNKKVERRKAEEMGLSVKEVREIKNKSAMKSAREG